MLRQLRFIYIFQLDKVVDKCIKNFFRYNTLCLDFKGRSQLQNAYPTLLLVL